MKNWILTTPGIDEPIAKLRHPQPGNLAELLLLLLSGVRVGNMVKEPLLQIVGRPLGQITAASSRGSVLHGVVHGHAWTVISWVASGRGFVVW